MGKSHPGPHTTRPPAMSKYAKKVAERNKCEALSPAPPPSESPAAPPAKKKVGRTKPLAEPGIVRAVVSFTKFPHGYAILKAGEDSIMLGINILHRDHGEEGVFEGCIVECEIHDDPSWRGPKVKRVLSVSPPKKPL